MPCKIQIKEQVTLDIQELTDSALNKSLDVAQSIAREVNNKYKTSVVRFVQTSPEFIDRIINIPQELINKYYNRELALEEEQARLMQMEDAKRAEEDYTDRYLFQTNNLPASEASKEVIKKVKDVIAKMGVSLQDLSEYAKNNPNIDASSINALADLTAGIIAISEGKEDVAITEEMVHIATAIIEQKNPQLVTEMISKIGRFKIYKDTLDTYKDLPAYQLPNGKPNIRKIKKEAVDKMITAIITNDPAVSLEEVDQSLFRRMWNMITDWFRGQYKKANIDVFSTTAETLIAGEFEGSVLDLSSKELYYQVTDAQKAFQRRIQETKDSLRKIESKEKADPLLLDEEEATSYYEAMVNGEWKRVTKRVTDRVKRWYGQRFGDKEFSAQEKKDNEVKRVLGTEYHGYFEEAHARFFNEDGTRRQTPGLRPNIKGQLNNQVYDKLEKYYTDLIASFSENGKNPLVFSEVQIYDEKNDEAGTIDLLIVEQDGTANIFDWKFMSIAKGAEDVAWYKQGAYGIQLGQYKKMLIDNYGIKKIGKNKAVPIIMDLKRENFQDPKSNLQIKGIKIGSVDPKQIDDLTLTPVSEESETTGVKELDDLIVKLNAVQAQISKSDVTNNEERLFKIERLNIINKAIRSIRGNQNIGPLVDTIQVMRREGENIISEYQTSYEGRPADDKDLTDDELSEFAENMREYIASANVFSELSDTIGDLIYTKEMEQKALTEKEKEELAERKKLLQKLDDESKSIRRSRTKIVKLSGEFADKFVGERNLVTGLMNPERVVRGLSSLFRGLSDIGLKALDILYKLANRAMGLANEDSLKEVNQLLAIRDKLKARGGNLREQVLKLYQRDSKGGLVNKLIYKYQREFFTQVDENALEGKRSKKWLKDNIDLKGYAAEAKPILEQRLKRIDKTYDDGELKEKLMEDERRKWDVNRPDFNGWSNYVIKRHPLEKWESQEYINLKKDPELFQLYNFISAINSKAKDVGYIDNRVQSTFLPFIRKSMAESLAWDFSLSAINNFSANLSARADDVGYGSINELTGELENSIPKYYTTDFTKTEEGINDYSDVSTDLFKNMILYINHMNKYKYLSSIEGQLLLVKTSQQFKKNIKTGKFGKPVMKDGKLQLEEGNKANLEIIDQFYKNVLYGQKYALDDSDVEVPILGPVLDKMKGLVNKVSQNISGKDAFEIGGEPTVTSLHKTMDFLNRYVQLKALGFEFISGAVNYFGGNLQISAQAGKYFKAREVAKYQARLLGNKFKNDDERKMFIQLIDKFMPLKDDPTYDKMVEAGMSKLTDKNYSDLLFVFFRQPEQHLEKSIFMALLDNMMVENGKLVNIRDFVKNKYKNRYNSAAEYRELSSKIDQEIEELKKTRSINATKKLENGELVIPGLDLNNREELQRLTNVARTISRTATGGSTEFDNNRMNMNVWLRSLMVFKGWIPKLVDTRFGEFRKVADDFNVEIDEDGLTTGERYDIGRVRLFGSFLQLNILNTIKDITDVLTVTDAGVKKLDEMYEKYTTQYFEKNGVEANITKEEFTDMIRLNLRNQVKELAILASLWALVMSMGAFAPDDDEDKATKNAFKFAQKTLDKFLSEINFFYNPAEMANTLDSGMPAIGLFKDFGRFTNHFFMETTGLDLSDPTKSMDEVRKNAQPIKNAMKLFPISKSFVTYFAISSEEFAKEFDVTIQKSAR
jgi:hypothetical protein